MITRPGVAGWIAHNHSTQRIGLDVQHGEHVGVFLNHRAAKPPFPDVAAGAVMPVRMPGVGHGQRLHDPADGRG